MTQSDLPLTQKPRVTRLTIKEQFLLNNFVQAEYAKSGLLDTEFAEKAAGFLSIPHINRNHVASAREVFDLPSNRDVARAEKKAAAPAQDLAPLEKRLDTLEAQVRKLFSLTSREIALTKIPTDNQIVKLREELYKTHSAESGDFRAIELVRRILRGDF